MFRHMRGSCYDRHAARQTADTRNSLAAKMTRLAVSVSIATGKIIKQHQ